MSTIKVFISYASEDRDWRDDLLRGLTNENLEFLFDKNQIGLGSNWRTTIKKMLDECSAMVVLFSEVSIKKPWVLYECMYGIGSRKKVIFVAENGVTLPDPISDIQGIFISARNVHEATQSIIDELLKLKKTNTGNTDGASEEALSMVLKSYVDAAAKSEKEETPQFDDIKDTVQSLRGADTETYIRVIKKEQRQTSEKLTANNDRDQVGNFRQLHRRQAILGELLSQLKDSDPLYFFDWTDKIEVDGKYIKASKYLFTRGIYETYVQNNPQAVLAGSGGFPFILEIDDMQKGSDLENSLQTIVERIRNWIIDHHGNEKIRIRDARLPTIAEWCRLAAPKEASTWSRDVLYGCNLIVKNLKPGDTVPSIVGAYPASCSRFNCYDVIGNVWELCQDRNEWYIMGFSYSNYEREVLKGWQKPIPVADKGVGQFVGLRFVLDVEKH